MTIVTLCVGFYVCVPWVFHESPDESAETTAVRFYWATLIVVTTGRGPIFHGSISRYFLTFLTLAFTCSGGKELVEY